MNNYITAADWAEIEKALMKAQIPYHVSFDSHVSEDYQTITYDRRITIEPFTIQTEVKV